MSSIYTDVLGKLREEFPDSFTKTGRIRPAYPDTQKLRRRQVELSHAHCLLVSKYEGQKATSLFKCTVCMGEFSKRFDSVVTRGSGCPCTSKLTKCTNETVDRRLAGKSISRIGTVSTTSQKVLWECGKCHHEWEATPNYILNLGRGCPSCHGNPPLTSKTIDERLLGRCIRRVENPINSYTKLLWECGACTYQWKATPNAVLISGSGCPNCSNSIKDIIYIWSFVHEGAHAVKIGITNSTRKYMSRCTEVAATHKITPIQYREWKCTNARQLEKEITSTLLPIAIEGTKDGYTEMFILDFDSAEDLICKMM